jgi:aspartate aminotransferase
MEFTERVSHLAPEGAYSMFARAIELEAKGYEIIHMEIGQPDFPTFENIVMAGISAIE